MSELTSEDKYSSKGFIMIVDDVPKNLQVLCNILGKENYKIAIAQNGRQALDMVEKVLPDLILLDVLMPGLNGFEVCTRLKDSERTKDIPIIFLTAKTELEDIVKGFEIGAVDYFTKPFNEAELLAIIKTHLDLSDARKSLIKMDEELKEAQQALELAARTDQLTQLINRRGILEELQKQKARFEQEKKPFSLILGDIDDLKNINEKYGNDCGDHVLASVAETMESMAGKQDHVARWGEEEFLILLPETTLEGGIRIAEKIREAIGGMSLQYNNTAVPVTMTFGTGAYGTSCTGTIENCIKAVDLAVKEGKAKGKNCVAAAQPFQDQ